MERRLITEIHDDPQSEDKVTPDIDYDSKMEIMDMTKNLHLQGLYWNQSDDEASSSGSTLSRSSSFATVITAEEESISGKSNVSEESKRKEEKMRTNYETILSARGLASAEVPQPTTPARRASRHVPRTPTTGLSFQSPSIAIPETLSCSGHRNAHRRVTFDRVIDLGVIKERKLNSPKFEFTENGDPASPISSSFSPPFKSSTWQPSLSTPKKDTKKDIKKRSVSQHSQVDFMSKSGGLGLIYSRAM